jgi:hypothetical protein
MRKQLHHDLELEVDCIIVDEKQTRKNSNKRRKKSPVCSRFYFPFKRSKKKKSCRCNGILISIDICFVNNSENLFSIKNFQDLNSSTPGKRQNCRANRKMMKVLSLIQLLRFPTFRFMKSPPQAQRRLLKIIV